MDDYAKAEPLYMQARESLKRVLGQEHPDYSASLNNLAVFYASMGEDAQAEPLFIQALNIRKRVLGEEHPSYGTSLHNLAGLYVSMNDYAKAEPLARQALSISRVSLDSSALILAERQQLAMSQAIRYQLDGYISLALESGQFHVSAAREILRWKGATLVRQRAMRMAAEDPSIAEQFNELQQVARQLVSLSRVVPAVNPKAWRQRIDSLTDQKEKLEAQISRASSTFRDAQAESSFEDIQASLPDGGVLVDYLQFNQSRPSETTAEWESTSSLLAIVLGKAGQPRLIDLGPVAPVSEAIDTWRLSFGMSTEGEAAGRLLRQTLWEPVEKQILAMSLKPETTGTNVERTLLISADSALGRLPLGALPGKEPGTFLIEDHRIAMIPVPRLLPDLVRTRGERSSLESTTLLVGGVDYGVDGDGKSIPWSPLPGAEREITTVAELYRQPGEQGASSLVTLKANDASEHEVLRHMQSASILHFATHGLFESREERITGLLPETFGGRGATLDSSLSEVLGADRDQQTVTTVRTGLVLAGANRSRKSDADVLQTADEDGILMDTEILTLHLRNAEMIVLSACDTGQGKAESGEGLLGLQRAFQVAGARTTVASLWKVDDLATQVLMERFHQNLKQANMSRLDALREAQLWILRNPDSIRGTIIKDQDDRQCVPPYYWAAFQLSGDWR